MSKVYNEYAAYEFQRMFGLNDPERTMRDLSTGEVDVELGAGQGRHVPHLQVGSWFQKCAGKEKHDRGA